MIVRRVGRDPTLSQEVLQEAVRCISSGHGSIHPASVVVSCLVRISVVLGGLRLVIARVVSKHSGLAGVGRELLSDERRGCHCARRLDSFVGVDPATRCVSRAVNQLAALVRPLKLIGAVLLCVLVFGDDVGTALPFVLAALLVVLRGVSGVSLAWLACFSPE